VLENGQVTLHVQSGQLTDLIDRAIGAAGVGIGGLEISRDRACEELALHTDLDRLVQVFVNVIANAKKYCTTAEPALRIVARQIDGRDVVDFMDGLAICREIMGRLGGDIAYLPGQGGAAFRVTLPENVQAAKPATLLASQ